MTSATTRLRFGLAFALAVLLGTAVSRAQPAPAEDGPAIDLTCVGGMVPAVVHVKATVPRDAAGKELGSPLDYRYEWDFGDPAGRYNVLPGWNAAHVYDRPGQYTIRLTVRGVGGKVLTRSTWCRVMPDNRPKVYVAAGGNDASDGSTPALPVRTVSRAFQLARGDAWVLFRKGDTFDVAAPISVATKGLRIGNYSSVGEAAAPLPVLRKVVAPPKAEAIFNVNQRNEDFLVQGVEFDSMWDLKSEYGLKKVPARAFTVGGTNFAVRWCSFRNLSDGLNTELRPTGVLLQECHFSEEIRSYCVYANGYDHVYVGNVMTHSRQEHLIRATEPGVSRVCVAYNELTRPNKNKGSIEFRCASWFYVANNYFRDGTLRVGPQEQDKNQYPNWADIKCEYGVIQDNRLDDLFFNVRLGTYHVLFRNNVVRNNADNEWAVIVECHKPGYDQVRKVQDVRLEDNTVINLAPRGQFLYLSGKPVSLVLKRNVYIAPNIKPGGNGGALFLTAPDLDGVELEGNVFPEGGGGQHRLGGAGAVDRPAWAANPRVKNERYGPVPVDADDNVPVQTNAGAYLGTDKRERDGRRK